MHIPGKVQLLTILYILPVCLFFSCDIKNTDIIADRIETEVDLIRIFLDHEILTEEMM